MGLLSLKQFTRMQSSTIPNIYKNNDVILKIHFSFLVSIFAFLRFNQRQTTAGIVVKMKIRLWSVNWEEKK